MRYNEFREAVLVKLQENTGYRERFAETFDAVVADARTLGKALAAYQRALLSGDSQFDRWYLN